MSRPFIQVENLHKTYRMGQADVPVLRGVNLSVAEGEFVAVVGASGSGKSTLLHLMGALDQPDRAGGGYRGRITYDGRSLFEGATPTELDDWRNRELGFVFQFYHLLPELSVLENTLLSLRVGLSYLEWKRRAAELNAEGARLLEMLKLGHRVRHRPNQLSGGERQRVAIARAAVHKPRLLLADEPTGNLDSRTGGEILEVLRALHAERRQTVVMVTHDPLVAKTADRVVQLVDGKVVMG
jgi:ABC-type lipoprotein export system ATPase subunit